MPVFDFHDNSFLLHSHIEIYTSFLYNYFLFSMDLLKNVFLSINALKSFIAINAM